MPGLVFDRLNNHRLGYGYGHYDQFLSRYFASNPETVAKTKISNHKILKFYFNEMKWLFIC